MISACMACQRTLQRWVSDQGIEEVDLVIDGGLVVTLDADQPLIEDGSVAIRADRIAALGPRSDINARFRGRRVIDARRRVIRPGYVDAHVHITAEMLARGFFPDWVGQKQWIREWATPLYAAIDPHEEHVAALLACIELLRNGTTTFVEGGTIKNAGEVARAVATVGVRGVLGRWTWDRVPWPEAFQQTTAEALERTEALVDEVHGTANGRLRAMATIINVETATESLIWGLLDLAQRHAIMLNFHQSGDPDYIPEARAAWGVRPIVHLRDLGILGPHLRLIHMIHVNAEEIDLLAASDTCVVHCPTTALRLAYGASVLGKFPEMLERGITVGLGTDGADASDQLDMSRSIYLASGLYKDSRMDTRAMPPETVLAMATLHGARSVAWDADIGSLEVGKKADVVLLNRDRPEMVPLLNPANTLVYATDGRSVDTVIVDGNVLVEGGRVVSVDEAAVYREVQALAPGFVERTSLPRHQAWETR
jgi:cytosine/adenosine deaminase-related metal-dependent hydrolase